MFESLNNKWRFTKVGEDWFCISGLWRPVEGDAAAFTMLTCEPNPVSRPFTGPRFELSGGTSGPYLPVAVLSRW